MAQIKINPSVLQGQVAPTLRNMAFPMTIAFFTMAGFNIIDSFYVGMLGARELAAIGFTFPVVILVTGISRGISIGAAAVISQAIGRGAIDIVRQRIFAALLLSVICAACFTLIGWLTITPTFLLIGASRQDIFLIREYMEIFFIALFFLFIPMIANGIIRATGDTRTPMYLMLFAVSLNALLDPLLIFGFGVVPAFGLAGAAWATLFSRAVTFVLVLYILTRRLHLLRWIPVTVSNVLKSWQEILFIALPAMVMHLLFPVAVALLTALVSSFGYQAVAAYSVGARMEFFVLAPLFGLATALIPFVGQNFGANNPARMHAAVKISLKFSFLYGTLFFFIFFFAAPYIAALFSDEPAVVRLITRYLKLVPLGYGFAGFSILVGSALHAISKPYASAALSFIRLFILLLPLAFLGAHVADMSGLLAGVAVANLSAGLVALLWGIRVFRYVPGLPGSVTGK